MEIAVARALISRFDFAQCNGSLSLSSTDLSMLGRVLEVTMEGLMRLLRRTEAITGTRDVNMLCAMITCLMIINATSAHHHVFMMSTHIICYVNTSPYAVSALYRVLSCTVSCATSAHHHLLCQHNSTCSANFRTRVLCQRLFMCYVTTPCAMLAHHPALCQPLFKHYINTSQPLTPGLSQHVT